MALSEITYQRINTYEKEIKELNNKYTRLLNEHMEALNEITLLKKELNFFHREIKRHKYEWESMFYTTNEMGYMYELDNVETKQRERAKSL
jgi:hypothetical protein